MTEQSNPWGLSPREIDVAEALIVHRSNRGIARSLQVELRTIESHIHNIKAKMGLSRKAIFAAYAPHATGLRVEPATPRKKPPTLRIAINQHLLLAQPGGMRLDELHRRTGIARPLLIATLTKMRAIGLLVFHQVSVKRLVYWPSEQAKTEGMPILLAALASEVPAQKEAARAQQRVAAQVNKAKRRAELQAQRAALKPAPPSAPARKTPLYHQGGALLEGDPIINAKTKMEPLVPFVDRRFAPEGPVIGGFGTKRIGEYDMPPSRWAQAVAA